ncbi:unnamed protein product [Blepharisma stoltei]|uniref:Uncharacterized protein n=1 Tax=Blepharisma stoltei TaxID=1481888 RepID=A0AAU9IL75_9CILI|nr:unnamed protein product [Blepharisma stoltei]
MTLQFALSTPLPSAGIYGPFQVITRSSPNGKIYDANYLFGCVLVSASVSSSSYMTTTAATLTSTTVIVGSKDDIIFSFVVPASLNLWKHDIFEIIPDSHWTVSTNPTCASVDIPSVTNYIKGPKNDNSLPCTIADSDRTNGWLNPSASSIYIYGLFQDVIINSSYQIKLKVSSFTFPSSSIPSSSYSWTLKIWRWGTSNLIAQYTCSGPITPVPGIIAVTSWAPYNTNVLPTDIPSSNSFSIFTKLTFQISHAISSGIITVTFLNVDILSEYWYHDIGDPSSGISGLCYLNNYIPGTTCDVLYDNSAVISINGAPLAASSFISITVLAKLNTGAQVASIISNDGTADIDVLASVYFWQFGNSLSMTDFKFYANNNKKFYGDFFIYSGMQVGGNLWFGFLSWFFQPSTTWTAGTKLVVYLPFSNSEVQINQTFIKTTAEYFDTALTDTANNYFLTSASVGIANNIAGSPGLISITFTGNTSPGIEGSYPYFFFVYGIPSDSSDTKTTALPFAQSNIATFYECWAKVFPPGSSTATEFYNYVFSVMSIQNDGEFMVDHICRGKAAGIPIMAVYHALNREFDFDDHANHYYFELIFTDGVSANLGSGLVDGSDFPVISTSPLITPKATISSNTVTISSLGYVSSGGTVTLFLPIDAPTKTFLNVDINFYYVLDGVDPNIKMNLYRWRLSLGVGTDIPSETLVINPASYTVGEPADPASVYVTFPSITTISVGDWVGIGLPPGFTLSSSYSLTLDGVPSTSYSVSSSSSSFSGGFIIGTFPNDITILGSEPSELIISGMIPPLTTGLSSDGASLNFVLYIASPPSPWAAKCKSIMNIPSIVNGGTIIGDTCTVDKPYTLGLDSVDSTMTLLLLMLFLEMEKL